MAQIELPQHSKQPYSNRGKTRALVLILVHVAAAIHIAHWKATGQTISPVEPSEAMQTLEQGYLNAGFILFALLIVSTLIFGRFFCGWGCHVVALQDLSGWLLKKFGIRPKPLRSRFLAWVPLFASFYMFIWPSLLRSIQGTAAPAWTSHLQTEKFWATFPGPGIAILTFVICGFVAVFFLGNKGFCTYACPYGAFFSKADLISPGRIRVSDACNGCGHCTAVCTSNVRVHEEVAKFKMVVDSGCMKCLDCVDACPNKALHFGFGALRSGKSSKRYDYSVGEEIGLALTFLFAFYAFRGLYDSVPFLLTLGLAGIFAFLSISAGRCLRNQDVRLQRFQLRTKEKLNLGGVGFLSVYLAILAFTIHSALLQFHVHSAQATLSEVQQSSGPDARSLAGVSLDHIKWANKNGLFSVASYHQMQGELHDFLGDRESAQVEFERSIRVDPTRNQPRIELAKAMIKEGKFLESLAILGSAQTDEASELRGDIYGLLKRWPEAVAEYDRSKSTKKRSLANVMVLLNKGAFKEAASAGEAARKANPLDKTTVQVWAVAIEASDGTQLKIIQLTANSNPDVESLYASSALLWRVGKQAEASAIYERLHRDNALLEAPWE